MEWLQLILTNIVALITGIGGSIFYFRPKLKEANANALKAQTDAQDYAYSTLINRINQMEKMYNEQLTTQNKVISELREEVLRLTNEKFESDKKIVQLEAEKNTMKSRIDSLEKELQAYRATATRKNS